MPEADNANPSDAVLAEMRAQRELERIRQEMTVLQTKVRISDKKVADVEACLPPASGGLGVVDRVKSLVAQVAELTRSVESIRDLRQARVDQRARWESLSEAVSKNISPTTLDAEAQAKAVAKYVDSLLSEAESRFGGVLPAPSEVREDANPET